MSDIITTLHPDNNKDDNLYPNIKKENIPKNAITRAMIEDGAVDNTKIADATIIESKIANDSISTYKLKIKSVTTSRIDDGAVTKEKISDDSVKIEKISDDLMMLNKASYVNDENLLYDARLLNIELLGDNVTIQDDFPSKIVSINSLDNNFKGFKLSLGKIFNNNYYDTIGTYILKFKARIKRNSAYAYQTSALTIYEYFDDSLKGAFSISLGSPKDEWDEFKEYTYTFNRTSTTENWNYLEIGIKIKQDVELKDFYIQKNSDNGRYYSLFEFMNKYKNKDIKISIIGDSISDTTVNDSYKWHTFLNLKDGYEIDNQAISGSAYFNPSSSKGTQDHQFYNQALRISNDSDIVIVFGGFNDITRLESGVCTLGTYDSTDLTTIGGCINKCIDNILTTAPLTNIAIALPQPWQGLNPMIRPNNPYYQYVHGLIDLLLKICEYRGIQYLNLFNGSGMRPWDENFRNEYMFDGTHPNRKGQEHFLYPKFRELVKTMNWK